MIRETRPLSIWISALLTISFSAQGADVGTVADGDWNPGTTVWDGGLPPTSADVAVLGHNVVLNQDGVTSTFSVEGVTFLQDGSTGFPVGSLIVDPGQTLNLSLTSRWAGSDLTIGAGAAVNLLSGATLELTSGGNNLTFHTGSGDGELNILPGSILDGTIGSGVLSNSQINYPGALFRWQGGTLVDGPVENLGQINLIGSSDKSITGRLDNAAGGLIVHDSTGNLVLGGDSLRNAGTYQFVNDADITGPGGIFTNTGVIQKTGGVTTSAISTRLDNPGGSFDIQSGRITLDAAAEGRFAGANFAFQNGGEFGVGGTWLLTTGNGTSSPNVYVGTGTGRVVLESGSVLDAVNGSGILGVTAQLNFPPGLFDWEGGELRDGTIENIGEITLTSGDLKSITGRLRNSGTLIHDSSGDLELHGLALINEAGAIFDSVSSANITAGNAQATLENRGTIRNSVGTTIGVQLDNPGGSFELTGGTLELAAGALARFDDATFNFSNGAAFEVDGNWLLTTGNTTSTPNLYTGTGDGQIILQPGSILDAVIGAGILGVTAQLDFPGDMFRWDGGELRDGTIENLGQINLSGTGSKVITGRLLNSGTLVHDSSGALELHGLAFINDTGAVYDSVSSADITAGDGAATFENRGTFRNTGGTTIGVQLNNPRGSFDLRGGGTLDLAADALGRFAGADFVFSDNSNFDVNGTWLLTTGNSTATPNVYTGSGEGQVTLQNGSVLDAVIGQGILGVTAQLDFPGEMFRFSGGELQDGTIENLGQINLVSASTKVITGRLLNSGTIVQSNGGALQLNSRALINAAGASYIIDSNADVTAGNPGAVFENRGLIQKSGSVGSSAIEAQLDNIDGTLRVDVGTLSLAGTGIFESALFEVSDGAELTVDSTLLLTRNNSTSTPQLYRGQGAGRVVLSAGGELDAINGGGLSNVTAQLDFPAGMFAWEGGRFVDGTIENRGSMSIAASVTKRLAGALLNSGIIDHEGGPLVIESGRFTNGPSGSYDLAGDISIEGPGDFFNDGNFTKSAGAGTASLGAPFTHRGGVVTAGSGTLNFPNGVTFNGGAFRVTGGATLDFNASLTVPDDGLLGGSGTINATSVSVEGVLEPGDDLGTLSLAGDLTLDADSEARFEIAGLANFDQVAVGGMLAADGNLVVVFVSGFAPDDGDQFTLFTSTGATSIPDISQVTILGLAPGADFSLSETAGSVILEALVDTEPGNTIEDLTPPVILSAGDMFGDALAIDGNLIAVGVPGMDAAGGTGAVAIYEFVEGQPVFQTMIDIPDGFSAEGFGAALDLSGDTLVVGTVGGSAPTGKNGRKLASAVAAAIFQRDGLGSWEFKQPLPPIDGGSTNDGYGSAVSVDDDDVAIGAPEDLPVGEPEPVGAAHIFRRSNSTATFMPEEKITPPPDEAGGRFGQTLSVNKGRLGVGSPRGKPTPGGDTSGTASIYDLIAGAATRLGTVSGSGATGNDDNFGAAVDVDDDGTLVVGAPNENAGRGAAYVFNTNVPTLDETDRLQPAQPEPDSRFGTSVALDRTGIVIGAPRTPIADGGTGRVHLYDRNSREEQSSISAKSNQRGFGVDVGISGGKIGIGAPESSELAGAAAVVFDPGRIFADGFE